MNIWYFGISFTVARSMHCLSIARYDSPKFYKELGNLNKHIFVLYIRFLSKFMVLGNLHTIFCVQKINTEE